MEVYAWFSKSCHVNKIGRTEVVANSSDDLSPVISLFIHIRQRECTVPLKWFGNMKLKQWKGRHHASSYYFKNFGYFGMRKFVHFNKN